MTTYTAKHKTYYEANKERICAKRKLRERQWLSTPRGKFSVQKRKAKRRGIVWELSFDDWWSIWQESDRWDERGDRVGMYCMSRKEDTGPYAVGNVFINEFGNNTLESYQRYGVNELGRFNTKTGEDLQ